MLAKVRLQGIDADIKQAIETGGVPFACRQVREINQAHAARQRSHLPDVTVPFASREIPLLRRVLEGRPGCCSAMYGLIHTHFRPFFWKPSACPKTTELFFKTTFCPLFLNQRKTSS